MAALVVPEMECDGVFREQYAPLETAVGTQDVFLAFPDGEVGVDWFTFSTDPDSETPPERDERMRWWREARFGQFVHWGAYSVLARGEWVMYREQWKVADYEKRAAAKFDPVRYRPEDWVRAAQDAGQRYLVVTAKHHDGFCLFDTRVRGFEPVTPGMPAARYDTKHFAPARSEPLRGLTRACRRNGIRFCLYYSILDWHHPSQIPVYDGSGLTDMRPGWKERYVSAMKEQLRELIERYDPDLLWFDGDWGEEGWWWTAADGAALYRYLRVLQPGLIVNERVKRDSGLGDFRSPEQVIPADGLPYDWETCMTMNDNWGWHRDDRNWKTAPALVRDLADIASKGGNFLLNVGPKADGSLPGESRRILEEIGEWMHANGESIYGTVAGPYPTAPAWGRVTRRPGRLYAIVFDPPADGLLPLPPLRNAVRRAYMLDRKNEDLPCRFAGGGIQIELPGLRDRLARRVRP
jgi:alpha-L-fucosidase